jgi:hypothetical protein
MEIGGDQSNKYVSIVKYRNQQLTNSKALKQMYKNELDHILR